MQSKCYRSVTVLYFFYYFYDELQTINYPLDETLFPPEIAPPDISPG